MAISLKSLRSRLQVDGWTGIAPASSTLAKGHRAIYRPDFVPAGSVVVTANRVIMDSSSDSEFTGQETLRMYFVKPQCDKETADDYWQRRIEKTVDTYKSGKWYKEQWNSGAAKKRKVNVPYRWSRDDIGDYHLRHKDKAADELQLVIARGAHSTAWHLYERGELYQLCISLKHAKTLAIDLMQQAGIETEGAELG